MERLSVPSFNSNIHLNKIRSRMQAYVIKARSRRRWREAHFGNLEQYCLWGTGFISLEKNHSHHLQRPENGPFGLRRTNSISSWVLMARKGHGWDVVILVSIFLSWLCCCCHWHPLLAERFGFQTSNQRLLISPRRAAFGLPLNSSLTPAVVFQRGRW